MSLPSHSGLYRIVREEYGVQALQSVRYYVNSASKESRLRQHIAFNHRCRRYGLTPRSLAVKPLVSTQEGHRVAARASRQFLSARVQQCYGKLRRLETDPSTLCILLAYVPKYNVCCYIYIIYIQFHTVL